MGTNYYYREEPTNYCHACERSDPGKEWHIGKSSFGWVFSLHVDSEIKSLEDLRALFDSGKGRIFNEYDEEILSADMLRIITERGRTSLAGSYALSNRELSRHRIDGVHCIGHGPGTWDLCTGEFS